MTVDVRVDTEGPSFDQFASFVREWDGISCKKEITPSTLFEDDLGITGDDGCELLRATEKRYGIALSSEEDGYRKTFGLGPTEFLFNSEGMFSRESSFPAIFGNPTATVRAFTVRELYTAVQDALTRKSKKKA